MTEYYVNITKEELENLDAVCVHLNTGNNNTLCIVSTEDYNELVQELEDIRTNTQNHIVGEITNVLKKLTRGEYPIPFAEKAGKLGDEDSENYFTYSQIREYIDSAEEEKIPMVYLDVSNLKEEVNNIKSTTIQSKINNSLTNYYNKGNVDGLLDNKEDKANKITSWNPTASDVSYPSEKLVRTGLNEKASTSHKHSGWVSQVLATAKVDGKSVNVAWLYTNDAIRVAMFRYYKSSHTFNSTSAISINKGLIPSAYRPKFDVVLPFFHYHLVGYIENDTGDFKIKSDTATSYAINTSASWNY